MNRHNDTCAGCFWADKCESESRCDEYTPMDSEQETDFYNSILEENVQEYQNLINEFDS